MKGECLMIKGKWSMINVKNPATDGVNEIATRNFVLIPKGLNMNSPGSPSGGLRAR